MRRSALRLPSASHRFLVPLLAGVLVLTQLGLSCNPALPIVIAPGPLVSSFDFQVEVEIDTTAFDFDPATGVSLNLETLPLAPAGGAPTAARFAAAVAPGDPLRDENLVVVRATRLADGQVVTVGKPFDYLPPGKPRAFRLDDPADLLTGPLAHNQLGDFMLVNGVARFVVQDGPQRDLYSVGQYGGNVIDAAPVGVDGLENFLEFTTMANVETVFNHDVVEILNDGQNGLAAEVRACGPDDLLDFVNPSSQIFDAGLNPPPQFDDNDQPLDGCTTYQLAPGDGHLQVVSEFMNSGAAPLPLLVGDWLSASGETDRFFQPVEGIGPASFRTVLGGFGYFGFDENAGVDYEYARIPAAAPANGDGSYVTISGVTVVLHNQNAVLALLGTPSSFVVPAGGSRTITRFFGVGDGKPSNAVDLLLEVTGATTARVEGCVTVDGAPAPGARVSVGRLAAGVVDRVLQHFVADAAGCYAGDVAAPAAATYGVAAALEGHLYPGGTPDPPLALLPVVPGGTHTASTIDLPAAGTLRVEVVDDSGTPLPARVTVVGFDPSPEPRIEGQSLPVPGFGSATLGLFHDIDDSLGFGLVAMQYTGADGVAELPLEPPGTDASRGVYHVYASRGTEYSLWRTQDPITITPGETTQLQATLVPVLETDGFVSSDFHVHGIASTDSRVSDLKRAICYAGEGVDDVIMTDHHAHTDLTPVIAGEGLAPWLATTVGEEITTFDYGHFNGYPFSVLPGVASGGSTDWAKAAPVGEDFPSRGALNATPQEIFELATQTNPAALPGETTIQVNHIGSHFGPLKIDTALVPPADGLTDAERAQRRLPDTATVPNLFHPFPALELWNGDGPGAQRQFLEDRIGIWFNHLNQGLRTTFIADTDSHRFQNLNSAGARTWTAASPATDTPATFDPAELSAAVNAGKAVGGQGIFVTTRLLATDGSGDIADLTAAGDTTMTDAAGNVDLEIHVQAPLWAPYDTIEIYANAATFPVDPAEPYDYGAIPTRTLGAADFTTDVVEVDPDVPGASRFDTHHVESFAGLAEDTWFVVVVRGSDGVSAPMFPVYPDGLASAGNATLADLVDGNVGEGGTRALGATNALYFDAP